MRYMAKKNTDYEKVILKIHNSWKFLKKHPEKETKGVDGESIETFGQNERKNIKSIRKELRTNSFSFQKMKPVDIGTREILVCTIRDRIVMRALLSVVKPQFRKVNSNCDFSRSVKYSGTGGPLFKEMQGVPLAAKVIQENIQAGFVWIFETDIKKFFDNIPKDKLLGLMKAKLKDQKVLALVEAAIKFQVDKEVFDFESKGYPMDVGIAQGSAMSPLLAGIYLNEFDNFIKENKEVRLVRYVDDFIIQCKTKEEADAIYKTVQEKMKDLGLDIHPLNIPDAKGKTKTRIIKATQGPFDFLGLTFNGPDINISAKKQEAFIEKIREVTSDKKLDLPTLIKKVRDRIRGFILQYSHPHYKAGTTLDYLTYGSQDKVEAAFTSRYAAITNRSPFKGLETKQRARLLRFFGIDFSDLRSAPKPKK